LIDYYKVELTGVGNRSST